MEEVRQLRQEGRWNEDLMAHIFPDEICQHIYKEFSEMKEEGDWDYPW